MILEGDFVMTYIYKLEDRDITFEATSVITALGVDGTRFGNYEEEIYIFRATNSI